MRCYPPSGHFELTDAGRGSVVDAKSWGCHPCFDPPAVASRDRRLLAFQEAEGGGRAKRFLRPECFSKPSPGVSWWQLASHTSPHVASARRGFQAFCGLCGRAIAKHQGVCVCVCFPRRKEGRTREGGREIKKQINKKGGEERFSFGKGDSVGNKNNSFFLPRIFLPRTEEACAGLRVIFKTVLTSLRSPLG